MLCVPRPTEAPPDALPPSVRRSHVRLWPDEGVTVLSFSGEVSAEAIRDAYLALPDTPG